MRVSKKDLMEQDEFWILLFVLGSLLLNWPFLSLVEKGSHILGYPLVLVYILTLWIMIILGAYLFDRWSSD